MWGKWIPNFGLVCIRYVFCMGDDRVKIELSESDWEGEVEEEEGVGTIGDCVGVGLGDCVNGMLVTV